MSLDRVLSALIDEPWAIMPSKLQAIAEVVNNRRGGAPPIEKFAVSSQAQTTQQVTHSGSTTVIPIRGILAQRMNLMTQFSGGTSTEVLSRQIRAAAADDKVRRIVFDIDSPGGSVNGVVELAQEIFDARQSNEVIAVANSLAASAAFWLGSQANEFVVTPSGEAGSIGVIAMHVDQSRLNRKAGIEPTIITAGKFKDEGNPHAPLGDGARQFIQSRVDEFFAMFVRDVARGRGVSESAVRGGFGQGRVLGAKGSVREGLADRIATLRQVVTVVPFDSSRRKRRMNALLAGS